MSIMYCEKHHRRWDSDKLDYCPECETEASMPESHEAVANELSMETKDPFTRMFVAALYWRAVALAYKRRNHAKT